MPAVQRPLLFLWLLLNRQRWAESTHARGTGGTDSMGRPSG
jgi:hypothetical protein